MMSLHEIELIVKQVAYRDWKFVVRTDDNRPYLQIEFMAADSHNPDGPVELQKSRKWWLSHHMCENEIVRTCYKALKTAVEHEVDENFTYMCEKIFNPHMNYRNLAFLMYKVGENNRDGNTIGGIFTPHK